jgi:hypothetical protein
VEVLDDLGIANPRAHLAAARSWGTITFVMTKSPLTNSEVVNIRNFCDELMFDPAILPDLKPGERNYIVTMTSIFSLQQIINLSFRSFFVGRH